MKKSEDVLRKVAKFCRRFYGGGNNFASPFFLARVRSITFKLCKFTNNGCKFRSEGTLPSGFSTDFRQMIGSHQNLNNPWKGLFQNQLRAYVCWDGNGFGKGTPTFRIFG